MNPKLPGAPASPFPDLQKYYDINFQLPLSNAGIKVLTGQDQAREDQRQFDVQQQMKRQKEKATGEGFQRVPKKDGGFAFFDNEGNEISAYQYSRAIGKNVFDVLADSDNPIDLGFMADYKNLEDLMQASLDGDNEKLQEYYRQRPELQGMQPNDLLQRFRQAYPTVYGGRNQGQQVGTTLVPSLYNYRAGMGTGSVGF